MTTFRYTQLTQTHKVAGAENANLLLISQTHLHFLRFYLHIAARLISVY